MTVTAADITVIMKQLGIEEKIVEQLKPDLPLLKQGLDSVDLPVIALAIEKKYHVDIFNTGVAVIRTINDLVVFLNEKLK